MMISFQVANDPNTVEAAVKVDADGDLRFNLNGVTVAWVSAETGELSYMWINAGEAEALRALGIQVDGHKIAGSFTDGSNNGERE